MKTKSLLIAAVSVVCCIASSAQQYIVSAGNDATINLGAKLKLQASVKMQNGDDVILMCSEKISQQTQTPPPSQCADCNKTISSSQNWQSISGADKVFVPAGLASFDATLDGGTLIVCGTNTSMRINFNKGTLIVYGSVTIENLNMNSSACSLKNYGALRVNYFNTLGSVENSGSLLVSNYANINGGSVLNFGEMQFSKPITINNASLQNNGSISVDGISSINGKSSLVNTCTFATKSISNKSLITNQGEIATEAGSLPSTGIHIAWSPTHDFDNPASLTPIVTPNKTTKYTLAVYDASNKIVGSDDIQITVRLLPNDKYGELDYMPYPKVTMNDLHILQLYLLGLTKASDLHDDFAIAADVAPPYSVIDMADFTALRFYILNPTKYPLPILLANGAF